MKMPRLAVIIVTLEKEKKTKFLVKFNKSETNLLVAEDKAGIRPTDWEVRKVP